jgi:hypothetical protein
MAQTVTHPHQHDQRSEMRKLLHVAEMRLTKTRQRDSAQSSRQRRRLDPVPVIITKPNEFVTVCGQRNAGAA